MMMLINSNGKYFEEDRIYNKCALEILDDKFKIIESDKEAKAYKLFNKNDVVIKKELINTETYNSLEKLYKVF